MTLALAMLVTALAATACATDSQPPPAPTPSVPEPQAVVDAYLQALQNNDLARASQLYAGTAPFPVSGGVSFGPRRTSGNLVSWVVTITPLARGTTGRQTPVAYQQEMVAAVRDGHIISLTVLSTGPGFGVQPRNGVAGRLDPTAPPPAQLSELVPLGIACLLLLLAGGVLLELLARPARAATSLRGQLIPGLRQRLDEGWRPHPSAP